MIYTYLPTQGYAGDTLRLHIVSIIVKTVLSDHLKNEFLMVFKTDHDLIQN